MKREKTGGRQKGTPNKAGRTIRERFNDFLIENYERLLIDIEELPARERVAAYFKVCEFNLTKLSKTPPIVSFSDLSEQERAELIESMIEQVKANAE